MKIFGKNLKKNEVLKRVGSMAQIADLEISRLAGGKSDRVRIAKVRTGGGLSFTVVLDRAMDIGHCDINGTPVGWLTQRGYVHPSYFDGVKFVNSFFGGLLTTCGLSYAGWPCKDNGVDLGIHGRISNIPAGCITVNKYWVKDDYFIEIKGEVLESYAGSEDLKLTRKIKIKAGENKIWLEDNVENMGFKTTEHMIIYHMNFGYPIVSEDSVLKAPTKKIIPATDFAAEDIANLKKITAPDSSYDERVYHHEMQAGKDGYVSMELYNKKIKQGIRLRYEKKNLQNFVQWKMFNSGTYVMGLEPSNCTVWGRAKNREMKTLVFLKPGEKKDYKLEVEMI